MHPAIGIVSDVDSLHFAHNLIIGEKIN